MLNEHPGTISTDDAPASFVPIHSVPRYPREFELLLSCSPGERNGEAERLRKVLGSGLDWHLVFRLANWHHMVPLLYWSLARVEVPVPSEVMGALKTAFIQNVGRTLAMTGELLTIIDLLSQRDIMAVPYKGPVLADRLYGHIALRQSADLDIIVQKRDVENAREVLIERGYEPSVMVIGANHDFQVESRYSERFDRPESVVELHWAFTNKDVAFPFNLEDLIPRLVEHSVVGRRALVFSPEDSLLILCVHGAKHSWDRLEWICGIASLIDGARQLDWDALIDRAIETHSSRRLHLGLALAHDLYQVRLPDRALGAIRGDELIPELARHVTLNIFDGQRNTVGTHSFGTLDHDLFHWRLADRTGDRLRYAAYRMLNPSRPERWSTVKVGNRSIPLHALTRPFGLILKGVQVGWRRARGISGGTS